MSRTTMSIPTALATVAGLAILTGGADAREQEKRHHDDRAKPTRVKELRGHGSRDLTVASLTDDVLTLTLADGTPVSGTLTSASRIRCVAEARSSSRHGGNDDEPSDDAGDDHGADAPATHDAGDDHGADAPATHDAADDHGTDDPATHDAGDDHPRAACGPAALVAGATVTRAQLRVRDGKRVFRQVRVVRASS